MIINRKILEEKLSYKVADILNDRSASKEFTNKIINILIKKGISPGETVEILDGKIPFESMNVIFLGVFCQAFYLAIEDIPNYKSLLSEFNIDKYFTEVEINSINGFKKKSDKLTNFIEFENVIQIERSKWMGIISNKMIKRIFDSNRFAYDPEQQRALILKKVGKKLYGKIDVDPNQIKKLKELILDRRYHVNTVCFNMKYGAEYEYDEANRSLKVPGIINVVDGWTRCNAILQATNEDVELEFNQPFVIMAVSPEDAADYVYQVNQQRKFSEKDNKEKSLDPAAVLVKDIQQKKTLLEGMIYNNAGAPKMFRFNDFVEVIECLYAKEELKNNLSRIGIMKNIIKGFDELIYEDIISLSKNYSDVELAYYNICIKISNDKNLDLIDLVKLNPIEKTLDGMSNAKKIKSKIIKIKERIRYE